MVTHFIYAITKLIYNGRKGKMTDQSSEGHDTDNKRIDHIRISYRCVGVHTHTHTDIRWIINRPVAHLVQEECNFFISMQISTTHCYWPIEMRHMNEFRAEAKHATLLFTDRMPKWSYNVYCVTIYRVSTKFTLHLAWKYVSTEENTICFRADTRNRQQLTLQWRYDKPIERGNDNRLQEEKVILIARESDHESVRMMRRKLPILTWLRSTTENIWKIIQ